MPKDNDKKGKIKSPPKKSAIPKINVDFGAHIEGHFNGQENWLVSNRTYQIPIRWDEYYAHPSLYDLDVSLLSGHRFGFNVRCVPKQYRLWEDYRGSPVKPESYLNLVEFLGVLIFRYGPAHIELLNEQNIGRDQAKVFESYFGAGMIDGENPEIGGNRYREMLEYVYPKIKKAYPKVKIHIGALMDNDFRDGFMRGMFPKGNRKPIGDALSFHYYQGINRPFDAINSSINRLRSFTSLPIILAETSVLAETLEGVNSSELRERQKAWLEYLVANKSKLKLDKVFWYTLANNGWMSSDLVMNDIPKPAYNVFKG